MSEFYDELDRREAQARRERLAKFCADRPENVHDYQGCAADRAQQDERNLREEILVIQNILNSYVSHGGDVWKRILARLESLRPDVPALVAKDQEIADLKEKVLDNIQRHEDVEAQIRGERDALKSAIYWALGENGDFAYRKEGEGSYWWRKELRERAALASTAPVAAKCEYCGPVCARGAEHNERVENGDRWSAPVAEEDA